MTESHPTKAFTVLIAEDDSDIRELLSIAIEKSGFEVVAAVEDGMAAWAILTAGGIDLAVLDISMPGMTGLELLRRVRAHHDLREQKVLIVTANVQPKVAEAVVAAGADGMITKPFRVREIVDFILAIRDCAR